MTDVRKQLRKNYRIASMHNGQEYFGIGEVRMGSAVHEAFRADRNSRVQIVVYNEDGSPADAGLLLGAARVVEDTTLKGTEVHYYNNHGRHLHTVELS